MPFNPPESPKALDSVVRKFREYCIGQTNETFKEYVFNSRSQKEDESINNIYYVLGLRTLPKLCKICQCLHDHFYRLQRYDLDMRYKTGNKLHLADTLSQHYPKLAKAIRNYKEQVLIARSVFKEGLEVEQDLQEINHLLVNEHKAKMLHVETERPPPTVAIYHDICDELEMQDGLLSRGDRLLVNKTLPKHMLQTLHPCHQGIEHQRTTYWPNMKSYIKRFTSKCEMCASYSTEQQRETLISHDVPDRP